MWSFGVFRPAAVQLECSQTICLWAAMKKHPNIPTPLLLPPGSTYWVPPCCYRASRAHRCDHPERTATPWTLRQSRSRSGWSQEWTVGPLGLGLGSWGGFDGHVLTAVHPSCFQIWNIFAWLGEVRVSWCGVLSYLFISCWSAWPW